MEERCGRLALGGSSVVCACRQAAPAQPQEALLCCLVGMVPPGGPLGVDIYLSREGILAVGALPPACSAVTHGDLSPTAAIVCVTLLSRSCMENHLSSGSILFWKAQGPSKWETLCTCWARSRNRVLECQIPLKKCPQKLSTLEAKL